MIYVNYKSSNVFSFHDFRQFNKAEQFMRDLCFHIGEENKYSLIIAESNYIEDEVICINIRKLTQEAIYYVIINLLAEDLANKAKNNEITVIKKRLEQTAFSLGYLSSQVKC